MRMLLLVLATSLGLFSQLPVQESQPQVDQAEVMRLGNTVQHVGVYSQSEENADAFVAAMSPPASDADKWFISVLTMKNCAACEKLKRDWLANEWLLSLANPGDPSRSWAHYREYDKDDQSQAFRWEKIRVTAYPTVILQPPRSERYGEPSTVVYQGVYQGDPEQLARAISTAIRRYVDQLQTPRQTTAVGHFGQISQEPPWQPTPRPNPLSPTPQFPSFDPTIPPPTEPTPASAFPWTAVLSLTLAGFSIPAAIALVVWLAAFIRSGRQAAGKPLLLDQATFDELMNLLRSLSNQSSQSQTKS